MYGGRCAYCGEVIEYSGMHVDHIIPKQKQHLSAEQLQLIGLQKPQDIDQLSNLHPSCKPCNTWKASWTLEEFREVISKQIHRLQKYSANYRLAARYGLVSVCQKPVVFYFEKVSKNLL